MTPNSTGASEPERLHSDYYTALYQAALAFSSSLELQEVLQTVVTNITKTMRVKACSLRLLDKRTGQLKLSANYGLSGGYLAKGPVDVVHSPIDSEALQGKTVIIYDVSTDSRFQYVEAARPEGLSAVLFVPLQVHAGSISLIRVT